MLKSYPRTIRRLITLTLMLSWSFFPSQSFAFDDFISSVDVMKYTKDRVTNQMTSSEVNAVVAAIMDNIHPEYISISVPLDDDADYPPQSKPYPLSVQKYTKLWTDAIRNHGAKVIFRGTWSGIEGIYSFPKKIGIHRFPAGTAASAAMDGQTTWLGKTYQFIINNPELFADGDIWAVLPERTEGIFADATSFLGYDGQDIQKTYPQFFLDLNTVSDSAFAKIGKRVRTGMSANNFSEVKSGWLDQRVYDASGFIVIDHYGVTHTPEEMEADITNAYNKYKKPVFLQEWGDYWNRELGDSKRQIYLQEMYAVFKRLADAKILIGFNYWGGWINNAEGIVEKDGDRYVINSRGLLLADFFASLKQVNPQATHTTPTPAKPKPANNEPRPPLINPVDIAYAAPENNDTRVEEFNFQPQDDNQRTQLPKTLIGAGVLFLLWYTVGKRLKNKFK